MIFDFHYYVLTYKYMHAVFVEKVEKVRFFRLVGRCQHIFRIQKRPDDSGQLNSVAHFRIVIAGHLLNDDVHQQ